MPTSSKNQQMNRMTNFMEEITNDILDELVSKSRKNLSPNAIQDIKAMALNRLWPMYTTTESGRDYLRKVVEQDKIEKDVIREIRAAMDIVMSNPR